MEVTNTLLENLDHLGAWGILTTDKNLMIVGWNRWLERHSGKRATDVIGEHLFDAYPDLVVRSLDRYYRQALEGQAGILSQRFHDYLLPMPPTVADCSLMHMQQTARISSLVEGNAISGTLTLIEDVTERVLAEQELRRQAERLAEANRNKDEFLAMLAHELRNPLAPIRNGVRLLDAASLGAEEARHTRAMIERQVAHMTRLIDDLLDVSRIVRGKVHLQKSPCDLVALLRQVAEDYQPILADNGIDLIVEIPDGSCWIEGDCIRLSQIVSNLLHNASKFTNRGGEVRLQASVCDGREFVVTIADTGIGMTRETVTRIFDAFSQAESTLARSKGGLGLGLALVKGLAELHEGRVTAHSEGIGLGSEFTVRLPIKEAAPTAVVAEPASTAAPKGKRVLIIEDNDDTALSMKMLINRLGFEVNLAYSGPEGIDIAREVRPDVVVCDIGLPGMDGFAVARALRRDEATRDAMLIAQSGYGQVEDIRKSQSAGFDMHLIKPVKFDDLERALNAGVAPAPRNSVVRPK